VPWTAKSIDATHGGSGNSVDGSDKGSGGGVVVVRVRVRVRV